MAQKISFYLKQIVSHNETLLKYIHIFFLRPDKTFMFYEILINLSVVFNIILLTTILYLFKWRKSVDGKTLSIVPNELIDIIQYNKSKIKILLNNFSELEKFFLKIKKEDSKFIKDSKNSLSLLVDSISSKDKEIGRLKEGYDYKVFKNYINRFLRIYQVLEEDIEYYEDKNNKEITKCLNNIKVVFDDCLLECDVQTFCPTIGENYKKAFGVSDTPERIDTALEDDSMKIAYIKRNGFKNINNDEVLRPAVVSVYKYKKGA